MYLLNLHFEPRLDGDNVERFIRAIKFAYPHITWKSGEKIDTPKSISLIRRSAMLGVETDAEANRWENIRKGEDLINDYDETTDLFDQLNESVEKIPDGNFVLEFDPPIREQDWNQVSKLIVSIIPNLRWSKLEKDFVKNNPLESWHERNTISYLFINAVDADIAHFQAPGFRRVLWDDIHYNLQKEDGPVINGWALINADTHDLFDQLNEASRPIPKRYKPKLNLFFDPPIKTVKEMELFLGTLNAVYPGLEWTSSGPVMNFNPLEDSSTVTGELPWTGEENEHDPIWFLTIGFFPDKPNKLTYTDGDEDSSLSNHEDYGYTWEDGRLWMNHRLPSSDELFDQLNENFQITDNMDLVGLNFTLGNASVIYKVLEKCYNPTIVTNEVEEIGWLVEWPNPLGYISPHGENLRACIGVNQMKRNFELGYYVPTNLPNVDDVFNQLSENTLPYDEPLKVGDKVSLSSESSYFGDGDENPSSEDLIGTIIEINHRNTLPIDVEWEERGWKYYNSYRESDLIFRGNRYNYDETSNLFNQLDESVEDDDLDWVTENSTNYDETSGLFDSLNEGYWEERYKSKRYTQKFEPGDRVIMNGNVGGKNFTNELGTVLKYKFTGGGTGHPHRVYLILFDTWNDKERNFLMSPVQADQNREFIDSRCREGSCWYTTSDNLEPAPDSSELFDSLNESDDNWFDDVLEPYSSMDVEEGEWEVIRQGHMYPGNITLLYYFNISNIRDRIDAVALENGIDKSEYDLSTEDGIEEYTNRIERATGYRVYDMVVSQDVIGDRYVGDRLYDGDICLKFKGEWSHETRWAKEPVYHMMRLRDNAHFVIGKSGVRRKEFSNLNEAVV